VKLESKGKIEVKGKSKCKRSKNKGKIVLEGKYLRTGIARRGKNIFGWEGIWLLDRYTDPALGSSWDRKDSV
jgi:hypothetical protein